MLRIRVWAALLAVAVVMLGAGPPAARAAAVSPAAAAAASAGGAVRHEVTYDKYSLKVDGKRVLLQSAELHYF